MRIIHPKSPAGPENFWRRLQDFQNWYEIIFYLSAKTVAKCFLLCYDVPKRGREHKTLPKNGGIFARKYKNEVRIPVNKAIVTLENVEKRFGSNLVVRKMNMEIQEGEFLDRKSVV